MKKINKTRILAFIFVVALIASSALFCSCKKDDANVLGKGNTSFKLEVTDDKGETKTFTIKTNEKNLGDALMHEDVKLIDLDEYGMVSTVNGLKSDFDANESWWNVLIKGADATVGVFDIEIEKDAVYSFKYTIGFDMGDWGD